MKNNIPKFRAWHKELKRMYFVASIDWTWCNETIYPIVVYDSHTKEKMICEPSSLELMQWTGFKDMRSKDIFEGDVFFHRLFNQEKPQHYAVIWEDGAYRIKGARYDLYAFLREMGSDTEIVANIYENEGLLNECN